MNDQGCEAVAKRTGNPRFAWGLVPPLRKHRCTATVLGMKPVSKE